MWNVAEGVSMSSSDEKVKILIVDDEKYILMLLETHLSKEYDVVKATNGAEALEKINQEHPDLILTDVMMPHKNGFELCQEVKQNPETQFIPVVMVTALGKKEDRIKGLESGADDFLSKPFNELELRTRVKSLLRVKRLYDEIESKNILLNEILTRYVSKEVSQSILSNPDKYLKLGGEAREVTILFADIRGFTKFSERHSAHEVVEVLNQFFSELVKVVFRYNGTFDKYMGDCIMAFYGAPIQYEDDVLRAIQTAIEMQRVFHQKEGKLLEKFNGAKLGLGIGINTGEVIVGNIGSETFMDYTVVGDQVNIAKRLEEMTQSGQILISQVTYERIKDIITVTKIPDQHLKGKSKKLDLYQVEYLI